MSRGAVGLLGCVAVAAGVAAPVPKDLTPPTYFPSALGTKWEYARDGEKDVALEVEVTKVEVEDGVRTILLEQTAGPKVRDYPERYRIGPDGAHMLTAIGKDITPPRLDLRAKPKADDEWDEAHEWSGTNYTCNTKVGGADCPKCRTLKALLCAVLTVSEPM